MSPEPSSGDPHFNIQFTPEVMAGHYANFAHISHSPYEFTITFARVFHEVPSGDNPGIAVSRINLSPRFASELITALNEQYSLWTAEGIKDLPEFTGESGDED
ncbi:MAG: DUF3467 domain-containing protein [Solirubrobacteraceae bacterium]|jgi:hypothetical protein